MDASPDSDKSTARAVENDGDSETGPWLETAAGSKSDDVTDSETPSVAEKSDTQPQSPVDQLQADPSKCDTSEEAENVMYTMDLRVELRAKNTKAVERDAALLNNVLETIRLCDTETEKALMRLIREEAGKDAIAVFTSKFLYGEKTPNRA